MSGSSERLASALADRYRIERELGAGGMATVYLAHDLKHDRSVALKVLKPELAAVIGAERFLAEIKTTANLQHPHILALFDSGQVDGTVFYVMPFVEGESLRDRLAREKQLPIDDALRIAREVGDALHYAHGHGVIHRDIKPENILLQGGHALVADFGIALAASKTGGSRMTETGMSLGTPTYMSPEQAMGERTLDARTDIYALGCVLYEMLTGDAPFTGSTAQAIVAKVLTERPAPIVTRRQRVPAHVEEAVLTALEKLPADRFASAGEFVAALESEGSAGSRRTEPAPRLGGARASLLARERLWRTAAIVFATVTVVLAIALVVRGGPRPSPQAERFEIASDEDGTLFFNVVASSPDGSSMIQCSGGQVLHRRWDRLAGAPIPGYSRGCRAAAYSPDGRFVAIVGVPTSLHIVSLDGSAPGRELHVETFDDLSTYGGGIDWGSDDRIYVASRTGVLRIVPADGSAEFVVRSDSLARFYGVDVVPGARVAFTVISPPRAPSAQSARIALLDLESGALEPILEGVFAQYLAPDRLVVVRRDGALVVVPIDRRTRRPAGAPVLLPDSVGALGLADNERVDVGADGTLLYLRSASRGTGRPVLVDRTGRVTELAYDRDQVLLTPRLSPDGTRLAVEAQEGAVSRPVVFDLRTGAFTSPEMPGTVNGRVSWESSGRNVTIVSDRDGEARLYSWRVGTDSVSPLLRTERRPIFGTFWSRDGRWLIARTDDQAPGAGDIIAVRPGVDSVPMSVLSSPQASEYSPALSPDNRWLAYVSNDGGGRYEVRVTQFPAATGRWQISAAGGSEPAWSPDGRELFYLSDDGFLMAANVSAGDEFRVLGQRRLFSVEPFVRYGIFNRNYDPTRDGGQFVFVRRSQGMRLSLIAVRHWAAEIDALLERR